MGRHRRATPDAPEPVVQDTRGAYGAPGAPDGARHRRSHRKRRNTPVRTGLLGASAAVAMGTVAVSSGLIPGPGGYQVADSRDPSDRVQVDGPSDLATQGGPSSTPTDNGRPSASERDGAGKASPSAKQREAEKAKKAKARQAEQDKKAKQSDKPAPSPTPTRDKPSPNGGDGGGKETTAPKTEKPPTESGSGGSDSETSAEAEVLRLVNQERARAGCQPVTADPALAAFAADFSKDMAARDFFSHTTPDGKSPWDRAKAAGISNLGGENIARGQANAQSVMDSWMNSPGHRANILNCDYRTMGVGAHFASGGPWWTQNFGF